MKKVEFYWNGLLGFIELEVEDEETIFCPRNPYREQGTYSYQDWIKLENEYDEMMKFIENNQEKISKLADEEYLTVRDNKIVPMNEELYIKDSNKYEEMYNGCDDEVFGFDIILYKYICQNPKDEGNIYINEFDFGSTVETDSDMKSITFSCDIDGEYVHIHNPQDMQEDFDEIQQIIDSGELEDLEYGRQKIINGAKITYVNDICCAVLDVDGWNMHPKTCDYAIRNFYGDI